QRPTRTPRGRGSSSAGKLRASSIPGKQALRPDRKDDEKDDVAGQYLPSDVPLAADRLRDAEDDPAGERSPEAAEAAQHDHLERDQKPSRAGRRVEISPDRHEAGGDADSDEGNAHRDRIDAAGGEANQVGGGDIVGDRADLGADTGAVEQEVENGDKRNGGDEGEHLE